jgi:ABC-type enterochelin transport system ATPase subunit
MEMLEVTDLAKRHLGELSGGQRQRVYVAQGIAQQHEALQALLLLPDGLQVALLQFVEINHHITSCSGFFGKLQVEFEHS